MNPVETYLRELRDIHSTGAAVPETSYYGCLERLLNEVGKTLKPKVRCVINLANRGAGIPDGGLFTPDQIKKDDPNPMKGQAPSRGVLEVKSTADEVAKIAASEQVARYCKKYGLVLVTNYRDFTLIARDPSGKVGPLESYRLAASEEEFWTAAAHPRTAAEQHGERFVGYLMRAMQHNAPLADPKDLAWFLASYARDALARVKGSNLPALASLRTALEESLGMKFRGDRGEHFFESTLIQTLFYGVFSAWVLWAKEHPPTDKTPFNWHEASAHLRVPVLRKLFHEFSEQGQLEDLNLVEVLNWATTALNRVDRASFFEGFEQHHAVQYFYEPFLEAYDPELRKQLGVWYTPPEIVTYMVKRVDRVLREELGVEDGLADPRVYVLDPCCGTGAFLVGVLDQIAATLRDKGGDALVSHDLKTAVQQRVFGFEILPAPYVVSHLQLGLRLADLQVPLTGKQRVGVYLTNALTGWEPPKEPQARLPFVEFQEEHDAADSVKQSTPILVILGNPPYNGFADIEVGEERDLSTAYRTTKKAPAPQGQGLNDLYIRFFRMAERRIVDKTHQGIVCYISNYSWLDGLSHTGMRERYMEAFDKIWIDNLHGDRMMSEYAPDGRTSETVFAIAGKSTGIKIGTGIALLLKKPGSSGGQGVVRYRDFEQAQAEERRGALLASADQPDTDSSYEVLQPVLELGLPFKVRKMSSHYLQWASLPDLFATYIPAVKTSRDDLVSDSDREALLSRMKRYFDKGIGHEALGRMLPAAMRQTATFAADAVRERLVRRGFDESKVTRCAYRPFDAWWMYWEVDGLLDRPRPELFAAAQEGNLFLTSRQKGERQREGSPFYVTSFLPDYHLTRPGSTCFPLFTPGKPGQPTLGMSGPRRTCNLTNKAKSYMESIGLDSCDDALWMHVLAIGHSPAFLAENAGALWQDWPRIPLPATREALEASAALGRQIAALLDVAQSVKGVTTGKIGPELKTVGLITHVEGKQINDADDLAVTAGWGNPGRGGITMPAGGDARRREYAPDELHTPAGLGAETLDIYLNDKVYWRNIPTAVWEYVLGGYPVLRKWLSYREHKMLGRPLRADEARYVTEMARRIAAILLMQQLLDEDYMAAKGDAMASRSDDEHQS